MKIIDTHAHFEGSREETREILKRAFDAGLSHIVAVGGCDELNRGVEMAAEVANENRENSPIILKAPGWDREQFARELPPLNLANCCALGEMGLDYHYDPNTRKEQVKFFATQLELARENNLPVIIHTREADDDTLGLLREIPSRGVIHCFTGNPDFCRALLDLGFFISFSGIVTFRAAENVRESAHIVPLDRLLIETDAPFLAPVPKRGMANEPAFIVHTAQFLANFREISTDELIAKTSANAHQIFAIK